MCGIAGIVEAFGEPVSPPVLQKMAEAIRHRGPDGQGSFVQGSVGLAHRRLAIIDLSPAGHQPMMSNNQRYVLTFNGEIYNFRELRLELEAAGHRFHSETDSEVVLEAFAEWGPSCLDRFNGMFAFAIWDQKERKLFIARDRYGIKPLYYCQLGRTLLFGSEVKAFFAYPKFSPGMDPEALLEYMTFQNIFTDKTLFKSVKLLPAGYQGMFDAERGEFVDLKSYWDFEFREPERPLRHEEYIEELDYLFRQAVTRQLVSDVPIGSYLSGGMDSGSITAIAARQLPYMNTFTVGFDLSSASGMELNFDERQKAEEMSYLFKTEHYEMVLKSGDMERAMPQLVWHLEDLRVGQSYPNFYSAKLASKFVKVVLSGGAGDELFGGYPWRYYRAAVNSSFEHYIDKYYLYWQRLIPNRLIQELFQPIWSDVKDVWTRDIFRNVFHRNAEELNRPEDYVNHSLYLEAKTFLHGLLIVEDKLSMAHGLEARVPFLDNDLVDFAQRLPVGLKLGKLDEVVRLNENEPGAKTKKYFEKTRDGKLILRDVMRKYIPDSVTEREKQGFSAPDASWFRGESIDFVKGKLLRKNSGLFDFLDKKKVELLVDEHSSGKVNRRLCLWSLLCLDEWVNQFGKGSELNKIPAKL